MAESAFMAAGVMAMVALCASTSILERITAMGLGLKDTHNTVAQDETKRVEIANASYERSAPTSFPFAANPFPEFVE